MNEKETVMLILKEYFPEEVIQLISDELYACPLCILSYEKQEEIWMISFDNSAGDMFFAGSIVKDFFDNGLDIEIAESYWSIFNKDDICVGSVFTSDVANLIKNYDLSEDQALEMITNKLSQDYIEERKKKSLH